MNAANEEMKAEMRWMRSLSERMESIGKRIAEFGSGRMQKKLGSDIVSMAGRMDGTARRMETYMYSDDGLVVEHATASPGTNNDLVIPVLEWIESEGDNENGLLNDYVATSRAFQYPHREALWRIHPRHGGRWCIFKSDSRLVNPLGRKGNEDIETSEEAQAFCEKLDALMAKHLALNPTPQP